MKTRNLLAKKMKQFYNDIQKKKKRNGKRMRLKTGQEFKQRKIYDLNKKFNVDCLQRASGVEKLLLQSEK